MTCPGVKFDLILMVSSMHGDEESPTTLPVDPVFIPLPGLAANTHVRHKMTDPLAKPSATNISLSLFECATVVPVVEATEILY